MGAELFYMETLTHRQTYGRTDRQTDRHDEVNSHFSQILRTHLKRVILFSVWADIVSREKVENNKEISHRMIPTFIHIYTHLYTYSLNILNCKSTNFDVLLTVHLSTLLAINQHNAQNLLL